MESGYVSREVSPSRQSTVPGPINIERSVETGTTSNQSPDFSEVVTKPCDPPVITFHHKRIDHSESESRLKASNTKGSYLTRECRSRRGIFILSYIINCSTVKHIVIPPSYKARKLLKIEDLLPEVFSVIESIDECLIPLVPPEDDVTKDVNVEIGVNLLPGQEKIKNNINVSQNHIYINTYFPICYI